MSKYQIQEYGKDKVYLFDTDEALEKWVDRKENGEFWICQTLYRMKDFWAVENTSNYVYGHPNADFRTPKEATYWLIDRRHKVPPELKKFKEECDLGIGF